LGLRKRKKSLKQVQKQWDKALTNIQKQQTGGLMYDNYDKILDRVRGIIVQELPREQDRQKVLTELSYLQHEIEEIISGRLEQMSADEQD
jgi:nickel-dependent lactate racemase